MTEKEFVGFSARLSDDRLSWNVQFFFSDGTEEQDHYPSDAVGTHGMLQVIGMLAGRLNKPQ